MASLPPLPDGFQLEGSAAPAPPAGFVTQDSGSAPVVGKEAPLGWQVATVDNGDGKVHRVAFSPDGKQTLPLADPADDGTVGAMARGAEDSLTLGLAPRLNALGDMVNNATGGLTGAKTGVDGYSANLDLERARASGDEEHHQAAHIVGELLGGLALPAGMDGVAFKAGKSALLEGATMAEARAIAARAATKRAAMVGAGYGGAYGLDSSYGSTGERLASAGLGAATGAAGGLALGKVGEALAPGMDASRVAARVADVPEGSRVGDAAARIGLDVLPADVGGPTIRRLTSAGAQLPGSAAPIINQAKQNIDAAQGVRDRVAQSVGAVLNPEAAGETGLAGARSFIAQTSARGNALYRQAEAASNGVQVEPTNALANLDQHISDLSQTPGGKTGLDRLQGLRDALSQGTFSVAGIRNMRTQLRDDFAQDGLRGSDIERRVNQVTDAANDDVTRSLNDAGRPEAARAYQVADRYWRNRLSTIDDTLEPIIGRNGDASGEQVVQRLQTAMKGNNARFGSFLKTLAPEEQATVRASLIGQLGKATKGAQNDTGDAFSLQTFLTHWNDIGESAKARLFGPETRSALNDLATVASGARQTATYANRSNTGGAVGGLLTGATGLAGLPTLAGSLIAQYGAGRLLASPKFARWLARAPRTSLGASSYVERLGRMAKSEPAIAANLLQVQKRLESAINGGQTSLAAQEPDNETSGVDR